ncbi:MAG: hypothetical protein WC369_00125 [Dehalococcoidales bacterium]|jgi:hypothetical protein
MISGPLSSGFLFYINKFIEDIKKFDLLGAEIKLSNEWLLSFILEYYYKKNNEAVTLNELLDDESKSKKLNIEEIYIAIEDLLQALELENSSGCPTNEEVDKFLGERDLIKYIHNALSTITYYCHSLYHRILASYIIAHGGHVISFNWDILFDEELFATGKWDYGDGYGFKPIGFVDKNKMIGLKDYDYKEKDEPSANIILKPHGSLNWYKKSIAGDWSFKDDPNAIYIGIPVTRLRSFKGGMLAAVGRLSFFERYRDSKEVYESLILPPGKKRKKFSFIWENIKKELESADHITAIGFSFNDYDRHIIEEFNNVKCEDNLRIDVVNPDFNSVQKYKDIFKTNNVDIAHKYFSEYCEWIVSQPGMDKYLELVKRGS